jgi:hypothetical protein
MSLSVETIRAIELDNVLLDALSTELQRWVPDRIELDDLVALLPTLPSGLRAMCATVQFDVSMGLDEIGWHFANWHNLPYCLETSRGLHELEATVAAEVFGQAMEIVAPFWDTIGELLDEGADAFVKWYINSKLIESLMPLNERFWNSYARDSGRYKELGFSQVWVDYARKYPKRMIEAPRR